MRLCGINFSNPFGGIAQEQPNPAAAQPQPPRPTPLGDTLRELSWLGNKLSVLLAHQTAPLAMAAMVQYIQLISKNAPKPPLPLESRNYLTCQQILNNTSLIAPSSGAGAPSGAGGGSIITILGVPHVVTPAAINDCRIISAFLEATHLTAQLDVEIDQRGIDQSYRFAELGLAITTAAVGAMFAVPYLFNKLAYCVDRVTSDANEWTGATFRKAAKCLAAFGLVGTVVEGFVASVYEGIARDHAVDEFDPSRLNAWNPAKYRHDRIARADAQRKTQLALWSMACNVVLGVVVVPLWLNKEGKNHIARETEEAAARLQAAADAIVPV